jgi:hypothetical protein
MDSQPSTTPTSPTILLPEVVPSNPSVEQNEVKTAEINGIFNELVDLCTQFVEADRSYNNHTLRGMCLLKVPTKDIIKDYDTRIAWRSGLRECDNKFNGMKRTNFNYFTQGYFSENRKKLLGSIKIKFEELNTAAPLNPSPIQQSSNTSSSSYNRSPYNNVGSAEIAAGSSSLGGNKSKNQKKGGKSKRQRKSKNQRKGGKSKKQRKSRKQRR